MNDRLRKLPTYPMEQLAAWTAELERRGARVFDFGTGDPREPTPQLLRQAMFDGTPAVSQYPPTRGPGRCARGLPRTCNGASASASTPRPR